MVVRKRSMLYPVLAAGLVFSLAACGSSGDDPGDNTEQQNVNANADNDGNGDDNNDADNDNNQTNDEDDELGFELRTEKWKTELDDYFQFGAPAVHDGTVFVGSSEGVLALDSEGEQLGAFEEGDYQSNPAIDADGVVYAKSVDGTLRAFDTEESPDGLLDEPAWSFETDIAGEGASIDSTSSPAVGPDGSIYLVSVDEHVYALAPQEDGQQPEVEWSFEMDIEGTYEEWGVPSSPTVGPDGRVYAGGHITGGDGSKLYGITAPESGDVAQKAWSVEFEGSFESNPAMNADGELFVVTHTDVKRIDTTAENPEETVVELGDESLTQMSPAVGFSTPITEEGLVFIGTRATGNLRAFDPAIEDGDREVWTFRPDHARDFFSTPVVGADGTIYVASDGTSSSGDDRHFLYAVNPDSGEADWAVELDDQVRASSPALADGIIYVGTETGDLYAIEADSSEPAASDWPMYGRDQHRTSSMP